MTDSASEIADFYPTDFAIDINGKKFAWQAVVLLPFIEEERLVDAISEHEESFTAEEARRNSHGVPLLFVGEEYASLFAPLRDTPPGTELQLTPELRANLAGIATPLAGVPRPSELLRAPEFRGVETNNR